jgi:uncharacterized membrane protein
MIRAKHSLYHRLFVVAVVLKGLNGLLELVAGASVLAIGHIGLNGIVTLLTARELSEDPNDLFANLLRRWFAHMSPGAERFAAIYLLTHGVAKIVLAIGLLRERSWAFPVATAFFTIFIAYMSYRMALAWSWSIATFCLIDLVTLCLVLREWRVAADMEGKN